MEGGGGDTLGMRLYQLHVAANEVLLSSKNIYYDPTMCQVLFYVPMNNRHGSLELSRGMRQLIESQYCTNNSRWLRKTKHDDGMESRVTPVLFRKGVQSRKKPIEGTDRPE